ncbi:hypothetical protein AT5A_26480 [Agrobacterium tumefaciens 5A]|nr:hypothetical protein AT5A_26480 [Agrobacterium tumefaciens 5A]
METVRFALIDHRFTSKNWGDGNWVGERAMPGLQQRLPLSRHSTTHGTGLPAWLLRGARCVV